MELRYGIGIALVGVAIVVLSAFRRNPVGRPVGSFGASPARSGERPVSSEGGLRKKTVAARSSQENGSDSQIGRKRKGSIQSGKLERWLRYSGLPLTPVQYRAMVAGCIVGIYVVLLLIPRLSSLFQIVVAFWAGSLIASSHVGRRVKRRFNAFDRDFSAFLLAIVGLLKSGMNIITAMEAAAERLSSDSMVRAEVVLMLERLRFGVGEEHAIGEFAQGIDHADIELFVHALLISRKVGGSLSDTLERLSRQAKRRAQFRLQAKAAVGQQRGSVWLIIIILAVIQVMLYFQAPELVLSGLKSDGGFLVWQVAFIFIFSAVRLIERVTRIRV